MRYQILELLGSGGTGEVYRARDAQLDRVVALKVLRGEDPRLLARLLREARAQARVPHAHICEVYEVGQQEGRTFIAMRLIEGETLDRAAARMSLEEKVETFLAVAEAVQAAHRHGLIHRDLKPGNVMVERAGGRWHPFVLDFGLALELEAPGLTASGTLQGTPAYMAPEQVAGGPEALDRRADVYSLGAMLYQILAGRPPFRGDSPVAVMMEALHNDPPPLRRSAPGIPADLEVIAGKCLEKEPARRYGSARLLAEDLERFLTGEPVLARPPSFGYRLRRKLERHRVAAAVAAVSLLLLLALGVGGGIKYTLDLERERRQALAAKAEADEVARFLVEIFEVADPDVARGETITAREILESGARKIGAELDARPLTRARLLAAMGEVYGNLGLYDRAAPLLEEALALRERFLDADDPAIADSLERLALLRRHQARYDEAEALHRRALAILERAPDGRGERSAGVLGELALVLVDLGRLEEAEALFERALARLGETESPEAATLLRRLGTVERRRGRFEEAERLHRRALALHRKLLGAEHREVATDHNSLGNLMNDLGRFDEAREQYLLALQIRLKVLGPDHSLVAAVLSNLGNVSWKPGTPRRAAEALDYYGRALAIKERSLGPDHPSVAITLNNLAIVHWEEGRLEEAAALLERALAIREEAFGPEHFQVAQSLSNLGELEWSRGRLGEAEALYRRAMAIKDETLEPDHPSIAFTALGLANLYRDQGRYAQAEPLYRRALAIRRAKLEPDHPDLRDAHRQYAALLRAAGREAEAEALGSAPPG